MTWGYNLSKIEGNLFCWICLSNQGKKLASKRSNQGKKLASKRSNQGKKLASKRSNQGKKLASKRSKQASKLILNPSAIIIGSTRLYLMINAKIKLLPFPTRAFFPPWHFINNLPILSPICLDSPAGLP